jgi:hypothetical protein
MSLLSFSDLLTWLQARPSPPREVPPFPLEELAPELREMISLRTGLRPLLRLAQANREHRRHIDRVFVHIFNRDVWAYVKWPTSTDAEKKIKAMVKKQVLEHPSRPPYYAIMNPVPDYFYRLLFLGPERPVAEQYAREQKLRLCDLYRRTCKILAARFVDELVFAFEKTLDANEPVIIRWIDREAANNSFAGTFSPPLDQWPWISQVLTFASADKSPSPSMVRHLAALTRLAPSVAKIKGDAEVEKAWIGAFMNLLLDVCMRFESYVAIGEKDFRKLGLSTLVRPRIVEAHNPNSL